MPFNKVILVGNLTRDPELKAVSSGSSVCKFGIAVNYGYTKKDGSKAEEVYFGDCECWGKTGEVIAKYFTKGKPILVEGRLRTEAWDDKEGKKQSRTRILCERFEFVGGKQDDDAPRPNMTPTPGKNGGAAPLDDDDIPFVHGWEDRYS